MQKLKLNKVLIGLILFISVTGVTVIELRRKNQRDKLIEENVWLWEQITCRLLYEQDLVGEDDVEYGWTPQIRRELRTEAIHGYAFMFYLSRFSDSPWIRVGSEGKVLKALASSSKHNNWSKDPLALKKLGAYNAMIAPGFVPKYIVSDVSVYEKCVEDYILWLKVEREKRLSSSVK